jgi:hypothetical protein
VPPGGGDRPVPEDVVAVLGSGVGPGGIAPADNRIAEESLAHGGGLFVLAGHKEEGGDEARDQEKFCFHGLGWCCRFSERSCRSSPLVRGQPADLPRNLTFFMVAAALSFPGRKMLDFGFT